MKTSVVEMSYHSSLLLRECSVYISQVPVYNGSMNFYQILDEVTKIAKETRSLPNVAHTDGNSFSMFSDKGWQITARQ